MVSAKHFLRLSALLALGASSAGCAGDAVNVGEQSTKSAALYPKSLECVPGVPYEPEVDWEGYVENSSNEYAAQRVRISLPDGNTPGFVLFGTGPRLPEATDPEVGWPCPDMAGGYVLPGYPYTIENVFVTDIRMQFRIASYEPMESWCALHEDSTIQPGLPAGCEPPGEGEETTDINHAILCQFCSCDSAGCRSKSSEDPVVAYNDGIYYTFDIGIDGDRADGSIKNLLPDISSSIGTSIEHARFVKVD